MTLRRRNLIAKARKRERDAIKLVRYYLKWDRFRTGRDYSQAIRELLYASEQRAFIEGLQWSDT